MCGCTDDRTGSHKPFPASIHFQIQAFQSARAEHQAPYGGGLGSHSIHDAATDVKKSHLSK